MKRKVIKQGNGTLTITLPKKWADDAGLKGGDEIEVTEEGQNLMVGSRKKAISETIIKLPTQAISHDKDKDPDRYILRSILINALRKGYDRIDIEFGSPQALKVINYCVDEVMGYEITEQSSYGCVVECVAEIKDTDFRKYFTRFRHVVINFSDLARKNLLNDEKNYEEIKSTFIMLERNYNTFCRFLMYDVRRDTKERIFLFTVAEHIYQGSRNIFYAAKLYSQHKGKLSRKGIDYAKQVFSYFNLSMDFITRKDTSMINDLAIKKNDVTYNQISNIMTKSESPIMLQLAFAARRMWDAVGPYMGYIL